MPKLKYQIGAVVYDEDFRIYRKAGTWDDIHEIKWAVYENGELGEVFDTSAEAKRICAELREDAKHLT